MKPTMRKPLRLAILAAGILTAGVIAMRSRHVPVPPPVPECSPDNGDITLPAGFCASIFADEVGVAQHIDVAPNGDLLISAGNPDPAGTSHVRGPKRNS